MVTPQQVATVPSATSGKIHSDRVDHANGLPSIDVSPSTKTVHPTGNIALIGLRLSLGFLFFWAFLDKTFGLGYATSSAQAWIRGGSPTKGFLSGANVGPLQGFFRAIAGVPGMDWLFMMGLLGIGIALLLGVALRPAAITGSLLVVLMWFATWPPATMAGGQPTSSTNPFIDEHILEAFALIVVAVFAGKTAGYLGRRWANLSVVKRFPWLR